MEEIGLDDLKELMSEEYLLGEIPGPAPTPDESELAHGSEGTEMPKAEEMSDDEGKGILLDFLKRLANPPAAADCEDEYDKKTSKTTGSLRVVSEHEISVNGFKIKICSLSRQIKKDHEFEAHRIDDAKCPFYNSVCLDFAWKNFFPSFSCSKCDIFIKDQRSRPKIF